MALLLSVTTFLAGAWVPIKAGLSQTLMALSWERGRLAGEPLRPWPWADHKVVARLRLPQKGVDQFLLDDDSGSALAFGPGLASDSTLDGTDKPIVVSGHRDTHFRFLKTLQVGDTVAVESVSTGRVRVFKAVDRQIVDSRMRKLPVTPYAGLVLVTCYPFDAMTPGGPLRFVVLAREVEPQLAGVITL